MTRPYIIRAVTEAHAMTALEDVQIAAWGNADRDVLPGTMFRISAATGGVVLAAYPVGGEGDSDTPFGLAYGFPAMRDGQPGHPPMLWHHSHLLAVAPEWRGSGAAVALKLAQRQAALAQGHTRMTWTFDPLIARNARLNLGKLGARAVSYHPEWYDLGGDVPADRLMIEWDLTQEHTERPPPLPSGEVALDTAPDGTPRLYPQYMTTPSVLAEVPTDADGLPVPLRLKWRLALREVLGGHLNAGYAVTGLARDGARAWYVLEKGL